MPATADKEQNLLSSLFQTRLVMNEVVRFILDTSPTKDSLKPLLSDRAFQSLCEISENAKELSIAIRSLLREKDALLKAKQEFNRLFVGPHSLPAPLWESVYLGREHLLFDEQTIQVRDCYHNYGLHFVRENNEPDDHIVVELEFLSYLTQQIFESEEEASTKMLIEGQAYFLNQHLAKWAPTFCDKLYIATKLPLYQCTAQLLQEYIELEQQVANFLIEAMEMNN